MSLAGQIGLLATRLGQEIKADRASLALKAPLASPALTGTPTAPTATAGSSSTTVATTAFVAAAVAAASASALTRYTGATSGGTPYKYQRLATLDGGTATSGAHISILVAGVGDYGTNPRGVGVLDVVQRGTGAAGIFARMEWFGAAPSVGTFYTVSTGNYTLEVWFQTANFQMAPHFEVLDTAGATVLMDAQVSTPPTGYVEVPANVTAPINSPTFTGVPRSVNPPGGQNDTMIATTSWAVNLVSGKANTNSPALTGTPTAPTASLAESSTVLANTAWVQSVLEYNTPSLRTPTSVQNGTQTADGGFQVNAGGANSTPLVARGVFDWSSHLHYKVYWSANSMSAPNSAIYLRFGAGGAIDSSTIYEWMIQQAFTTTPAGSVGSAQNAYRLINGNGEATSASSSGEVLISRFDRAARLQVNGNSSKTLPATGTFNHGGDYHPSSPDSVSDFAMLVGTGTANIRFKIFGL